MTAQFMTLDAAVITLGGTDYSGTIQSVELTIEVDEDDVSTFASNGWREVRGAQRKGGLKLGSISDYSSGGLDSVLWTAFNNRVPIAFTVQASNATVSVTNPKYTGNVLVTKLAPISGDAAKVAKASLDWPLSGTVSRTTS